MLISVISFVDSCFRVVAFCYLMLILVLDGYKVYIPCYILNHWGSSAPPTFLLTSDFELANMSEQNEIKHAIDYIQTKD